MGAFGSWVDATIASGASKTSAIDLGSEYDYLVLLIPGLTACKLWLEVAEQTDSTYFELGKDVTTDVEEFRRADVWRLAGFHFIKIVASAPQLNAVTLRIRGWRT